MNVYWANLLDLLRSGTKREADRAMAEIRKGQRRNGKEGKGKKITSQEEEACEGRKRSLVKGG